MTKFTTYQFKLFFVLLVIIGSFAGGCSSSRKSSSKASAKVSRSKTEQSKKEVAKASEEEIVEQLIKVARAYKGTPYKYGGTTRAGMDCSGLLCTSFQSVGITLPRTSSQQSTVGKSVKVSELQPGDLLFFSTTKGKGINHVGLVTEVYGGGLVKFIHSTVSRGVKEDELSNPYYKKSFVKATRPNYN